MADKFLSFMKDYPVITTKEEGGKLVNLMSEYGGKKDDIYKQYSHLFESKNKFERKYSSDQKYAYNIAYIWNWSDIVDTWSDLEYRTEDNPYIKIKNGRQ